MRLWHVTPGWADSAGTGIRLTSRRCSTSRGPRLVPGSMHGSRAAAPAGWSDRWSRERAACACGRSDPACTRSSQLATDPDACKPIAKCQVYTSRGFHFFCMTMPAYEAFIASCDKPAGPFDKVSSEWQPQGWSLLQKTSVGVIREHFHVPRIINQPIKPGWE